jgi:hypothetical protein
MHRVQVRTTAMGLLLLITEYKYVNPGKPEKEKQQPSGG